MNRLASLACLFLLATSLSAIAGDDEKFQNAIRDGLEKRAAVNAQPGGDKLSAGDVAKDVLTDMLSDAISNTLFAASTTPASPQPVRRHLPAGDDLRHHYGCDEESGTGCARIVSCPADALTQPNLQEVQNYFDNFTDSELWAICLDRSSIAVAMPRECACTLVTSPDPWRPVAVPQAVDERQSAVPATPAPRRHP